MISHFMVFVAPQPCLSFSYIPSDPSVISVPPTLTSKSQSIISVSWLALGSQNPLGPCVRQNRNDWKLTSSQDGYTPLSSD